MVDSIWTLLYTYVLEERLKDWISTDEHRQLSETEKKAESKLVALLTDEQKEALEEYLSAVEEVGAYEDMATFQEAVALGKWMAR